MGTRFRAQGREAATGVDCAGVAIICYGLPTEGLRRDYRLRGDHRRELQAALHPFFRRVPVKRARLGDLLLMRVTPDQLHLAVLTDRGFIHADARLRRVVETPGAPPWPCAAAYRRRVRKLRSR